MSESHQDADSLPQSSASLLSELFVKYAGRLRQLVAVRMDRRLSHRLDAGDIVQETFLHATRGVTAVAAQGDVPLYIWLRKLALQRLANAERDHLHTDKRQIRRESVGLSGLSENTMQELSSRLAGPDKTGSARLRQSELQTQVRAALERLPEHDREALVLRYLEQLSPAETAAVLNVKESTARVRVFRALARMREFLLEE